MTSTIQMAAQRTRRAQEGLRAAKAYDVALDQWGEFLTYWRKTLNRIDAAGQRSHGRSWQKVYQRVMLDPALLYLWEARNADEHGLAQSGAKRESAIEIAEIGTMLFRGKLETAEGPKYIYEPADENSRFDFVFHPEHLTLVPIVDRGRTTPVPARFRYEIGPEPAPVALAAVGIAFMEVEIAKAEELLPPQHR